MIQVVVLSCFFSLALANVKEQKSTPSLPKQTKGEVVSLEKEKVTKENKGETASLKEGKVTKKDSKDEAASLKEERVVKKDELIEEEFSENELEEDFVPSLSESVHQTHRQKRQLAHKFINNNVPEKPKTNKKLNGETAFENLEVSISQRGEEDLSTVKNKGKK